MPGFEFAFCERPVVTVHDRTYVLLDDLQPVLGAQLVAVADVTALLGRSRAHAGEATTVPVWYDGSSVCYVRGRFGPPSRISVMELPMWIALDLGGGLTQPPQRA